MKIKDLMLALSACEPEANIYMSSDGEGNSFGNPCDIYKSKNDNFYILYPDDAYYEVEDLQ